MLGLLTKIGLHDFRNEHSVIETIVDGFDEDGKDEISETIQNDLFTKAHYVQKQIDPNKP